MSPQLRRMVLILATAFVAFARADLDPSLVGTWTTKSRKVITGPVMYSLHEDTGDFGFYDPLSDRFLEPTHTGFSYSFTDDGYYEVSYYRAISNPTTPQCPRGIMQFQHGKYQKFDNGSLVLIPFAVDGRQLISDPCKSSTAVYTRYVQQELFQVRLSCPNKMECDEILMTYASRKKYEVVTDKFSNTQRLDLFAFDGAPLNPMYLAYKPPQMLPTQPLNPTSTSASEAEQTSSVPSKRDLEDSKIVQMPMRTEDFSRTERRTPNADRLWWFGAGITALGGVGYYFS